MIRLSYTNRGTSALVQISDSAQTLEMVPTFVGGDPMTLLANAVIDLMKATESDVPIRAWCRWENEPGEFRWVLTREGSELAIHILWFETSRSTLMDDQGTLLFSSQCSLLKFAIQVKTELRRLFEEIGADRYGAVAKHPFPLEQYDQLKELIRREQIRHKQRKLQAG
jgi:hypothetical protein